MAGVLNFDQYLGGADQIKIEQIFPSNQKTLQYNFNGNITSWTFSLDYQTIVVDTMTFNRNTGQPNFADSKVIGYFPKANIGASNIAVASSTLGTVNVTFPTNLYTGPIIPDARKNVPITIFSFTWTDANSPITSVNKHRFALVNAWEPGIVAGDPTLDGGYIPLVVA